MPWSKPTPGSTWASAAATPSKVLWLSLRTITRQASPVRPPVLRVGRSFVGVDGATVIRGLRGAFRSRSDASACSAFVTDTCHTRHSLRISLLVVGGGRYHCLACTEVRPVGNG